MDILDNSRLMLARAAVLQSADVWEQILRGSNDIVTPRYKAGAVTERPGVRSLQVGESGATCNIIVEIIAIAGVARGMRGIASVIISLLERRVLLQDSGGGRPCRKSSKGNDTKMHVGVDLGKVSV